MTQPQKLDIKIISDTICPWCYMGYKRMLVALEQAKKEGLALDTSIRFEPFQLDATLPVDHSLDKRTRYGEKYGVERFEQMEKAMVERGKEVGIDFVYGGKVRQTIKSHRLLWKAYEKGGQKMQLALHELLFAGYFEHEQDIGDDEFLSASAVRAGVFTNVEEAKAFIASDEGVKDYWAGIHTAKALRVQGVPFFILNDRLAIPGAVEPDDMLSAFKQALEM